MAGDRFADDTGWYQVIVIDDKKRIITWLWSRIKGNSMSAARAPFDTSLWYDAIGFENASSGLVGGVAYHSATSHSVCMMAAGEGNWLTKLRIQAAFIFPFHILGVDHIAVQTIRSNRKARKLIERMGFKLEGVLRRASPVGQDVFVYGMTKSECRWVKDDGIILERAEVA